VHYFATVSDEQRRLCPAARSCAVGPCVHCNVQAALALTLLKTQFHAAKSSLAQRTLVASLIPK
jgi:hypothetical protein